MTVARTRPRTTDLSATPPAGLRLNLPLSGSEAGPRSPATEDELRQAGHQAQQAVARLRELVATRPVGGANALRVTAPVADGLHEALAQVGIILVD